jgi:hypothetical protein
MKYDLESLRRRSFDLMTRGTLDEFWRNPRRVRAMEIFKRIAGLRGYGIGQRAIESRDLGWAGYYRRDAEIRGRF